jgi:hypothetical protein
VSNRYPLESSRSSAVNFNKLKDRKRPTAVPDPFISIQSLITCSNPFDESMPGQLNPTEAITLEQAVYVNTLGGAEVLGVEDKLGSIRTCLRLTRQVYTERMLNRMPD